MTERKTRSSAPRRPAGKKKDQAWDQSLGEMTFDDWYDTPIFEADSDERLEELATSGRTSTRLAASAVLKVRNLKPVHEPGDPSCIDLREQAPPTVTDIELTESLWRGAPLPDETLPELACGSGLRDRFNHALDRWAERETAAQLRLERVMLPKRWRS